MFEQLMIAYAAGMTLAIAMEVAKVVKARRLNVKAAQARLVDPAGAPRFNSVNTRAAVGRQPAAANESAPARLMQAAG